MKIIYLNNGSECLVDDEDYDFLNQWNWSDTKGYAQRHGKDGGVYKAIYLHRLVCEAPKRLQVDHINGNKLDNRKSNLRPASKSQNEMNKKVSRVSSSGYKGVSFHKDTQKWRAYIKKDGVTTCLGYFRDKRKAAQAYNLKAVEYFGDYARINVVEFDLSEVA